MTLDLRPLAALGLALLLAACGGKDDDASAVDSDDAPARTEAAAGAGGAGAAAAKAELTQADVEAFERGLRRESEAVRAAQERSRTATTPAERGNAIQGTFENATMPEGARAAGMAEARYQEVRATMVEVLRTLDFQGKIDGPMSLDTTNLSPERRREAARDPLADLTPATAAAIRARLDQLAAVWREYIGLTAVAG